MCEEVILMKQTQRNRPFGVKDKLGYMFGDFGNDFTFIFASTYLMIFYTKVLGISGALVGFLFMFARCVDAFTDVGMGRLVDKMPPAKDGRFRPWIRRMSIPVAIASTIMYLYFMKDMSYSVRVVYMFVTYILWGSICYTGINIPYGSMASVISPNASDRTSLSTFRSIGATLAGLVIGMITPLIIYTTDKDGNQIPIPERFTLVAIVFGVCAFLCYSICYKFCQERVVLPQKENNKDGKDSSFFSLTKELLKNRALLAVIGAALLLLLASMLSQTMNSYLFMDYFKNTKVIAIVSLLSIGGMLLIAPFATKISAKYGKKEVGSIGMLLSGVIYVIMFLLKLKSIPVFIFMMFLGMFGMGFFNMIIWAFITDVIDDLEVKTGQRDDGTVYAIYSFSRKLGQALAGGVGGFALTAIGYITSTTAVVQAESTVNGIYTVATLIPGVCYLLVFVVMFFLYPLSKDRVETNVAELKRRHGN